jgi:hypothetical protein
MIGRADDEQSIVALQSVQLIKKERTVLVVDEGIEVFEDQDARGHLPCFVEDGEHGTLLAHPAYIMAVKSAQRRCSMKAHF